MVESDKLMLLDFAKNKFLNLVHVTRLIEIPYNPTGPIIRLSANVVLFFVVFLFCSKPNYDGLS